jgi:tRNA threonylcarbamoyladenosine biosynthesis protein TsaE
MIDRNESLPAIDRLSESEEETIALGVKIAAFLTNGGVVALKGELGSGKTTLAKGIARALGVKENITSPTYTIINEYETASDATLFHIDAYRLDGEEDFDSIGGDEVIYGRGISIIEWSERVAKRVPAGAVTVTIKITSSDTRLITIEGIASL